MNNEQMAPKKKSELNYATEIFLYVSAVKLCTILEPLRKFGQ